MVPAFEVNLFLFLFLYWLHVSHGAYVFKKYPQKVLNGIDQHRITGKWVTLTNLTDNDRNSTIKSAAAKEGIYKMDQYDLHIFSSEEARDCLQDRTIFFAGDSYMVQSVIGLVDILLDDPNNDEIYGSSTRTHCMWDRLAKLSRALRFSKHRIDIFYTPKECRGKSLSCLQSYIGELEQKPAFIARKTARRNPKHGMDLLVVNILTHHILQLPERHQVNATLNPVSAFENTTYALQVKNIFERAHRAKIPLMWTTGPGPQVFSAANPMTRLNFDTTYPLKDELRIYNDIAIREAIAHQIPVISVYNLTYDCNWKNCTSERAHRSRFVCRMKAQLLLNNICKWAE